MSLELKTNTAVRIAVGPLVDPTDGKTAEVALTVTALSVQIYQIKTDGTAVVRTQFAPTASGGSNDMALVTLSTDGMYDLELTAAQINWLGVGKISFYDVDGFLVSWIDIHVVSANYFENKYGSTIETVNMTQISGTTQSATDLKDFADEGYDPSTNKVQGVVLTDTLTTYTSNTPQSADNDAKLTTIAADVVNIDGEAMRGTNGANTVVPPSVAQFNARSLLSADYVVVGDTIAGVTLVDTVTTNTDLVSAADVKTAMEVDGGDLSSLMEALVNKRVWTELSGDLEMFNDSGVSQGTVAEQVATDGTYTTAKRAVI